MRKAVAGANVYPARFIKLSAVNTVIQCVANDSPDGISGEAKRDARSDAVNPDYHALTGESVRVHDGTGNEADAACVLELGGTVAVGNRLMPDANGKGIVGTTGKYVGAKALQAGVSGDKILVEPLAAALLA